MFQIWEYVFTNYVAIALPVYLKTVGYHCIEKAENNSFMKEYNNLQQTQSLILEIL